MKMHGCKQLVLVSVPLQTSRCRGGIKSTIKALELHRIMNETYLFRTTLKLVKMTKLRLRPVKTISIPGICCRQFREHFMAFAPSFPAIFLLIRTTYQVVESTI
jgi:hypothetical protein